jgi:hypothetical protein
MAEKSRLLIGIQNNLNQVVRLVDPGKLESGL